MHNLYTLKFILTFPIKETSYSKITDFLTRIQISKNKTPLLLRKKIIFKKFLSNVTKGD